MNFLHSFSRPLSSFPFFLNLSNLLPQLDLQGPVGAGVGNSFSQKGQSSQIDFPHTFFQPTPSFPFLTNLLYCLAHFALHANWQKSHSLQISFAHTFFFLLTPCPFS
jgi:hypothetical protein